jgi:hypothetical protein
MMSLMIRCRAVGAAALLAAGIGGCHAMRAAPSAPPSAPSSLSPTDRIRITEAFRLASVMGDSVWPGWQDAPFAILLVTPDRELLVGHPAPTAEFVRVGHDAALHSDVYSRPRVFSPTMLATFPAVGTTPTIVVGTAESTGMRSSAWVLTVLHEHFHQWQFAQPGYYPGIAALGLARGDNTGMWMLNYPFPYDSAPVQVRLHELSAALAGALAAPGEALALTRYRVARAGVRAALDPADYRYLSFQLWQEGVARYTEIRIAELAARYEPTAAFRALPDYEPFAVTASALRARVAHDLASASVGMPKRVAFYSLGAASALMLDAAAPDWHAHYLDHQFSLDAHLP